MDTNTLAPPGDLAAKEALLLRELALGTPWRVAFGHLKGGVTKSTGAWLLAIAIWLLTGEKVLVVCADPLSQTLASAYKRAVALGVDVPFELLEWRVPEGFVKGIDAEMRRRGCKHLVVDVGGESEKLLEQACIVADELIVPTTPDDPDLERVPATLSVAARMAGLTDLNVNILITKVSTNPKVKDLDHAVEWLTAPQRDWPLLETVVPFAVFYRRTLKNFPDEPGVYANVLWELAALRDETGALPEALSAVFAAGRKKVS